MSSVKQEKWPLSSIKLTEKNLFSFQGTDSLAFDDGSEEKPNPVTWLDGVYTFDSQPLSEVVSELQRQFNIKISMNNDLSALMYTGFFRKNKLEEALYSVTWPLGLKYSVDKSGNVTISK